MIMHVHSWEQAARIQVSKRLKQMVEEGLANLGNREQKVWVIISKIPLPSLYGGQGKSGEDFNHNLIQEYSCCCQKYMMMIKYIL